LTRHLATLCKFYLSQTKTIYLSSPFILLSVTAMAYKIKYGEEADVLTIILKGKLSHAEEVGDIIVHFDKNEKPLFMEILKASKIIPLMVEGLAKKEISRLTKNSVKPQFNLYIQGLNSTEHTSSP
jgi:uncharacterized protein YuzE